MPPTLRPAQAGDLAAVHRLTERLADFDLPPGRTAAEIARADHHLIRAQLEAPRDDVLFLVAEEENAVVGTVLANTRPDYFTGRPYAYVEVLAVAREVAGRGIARALLEAVEEWAGARGLARVDLTVFAVNGRARGFYEHLGYTAEFVRYVKAVESSADTTTIPSSSA